MIDSSGWLDWATRRPGLADKVYSQPNSGLGIVGHSIEGTAAGAEGRFDSTQRNPDGSYTDYAAASVMFVNPKVGVLIQCYPVTASTWTSGNSVANTELWAVESEGIWSDPLTDNQIANLVRLAREWEARTGKTATRDQTVRTLWEHREVWSWATPNAGPTSCPSERYTPAWQAIEEDHMALSPAQTELIAIASGDYDKMAVVFDALYDAGIIKPEDPTQPPPRAGKDTDDTADPKRWKIINAAMLAPDAAIKVLN